MPMIFYLCVKLKPTSVAQPIRMQYSPHDTLVQTTMTHLFAVHLMTQRVDNHYSIT